MQKGPEEIAEWVNEALLRRALQSYKNDETVELVKFEIKPGFSEHYASKMYRAKLEFNSTKFPQTENEIFSVVIKTKPINDPKIEAIVAGGPLFETEVEVYQKVLPAMQQLYERNGIKVDFAPE